MDLKLNLYMSVKDLEKQVAELEAENKKLRQIAKLGFCAICDKPFQVTTDLFCGCG